MDAAPRHSVRSEKRPHRRRLKTGIKLAAATSLFLVALGGSAVFVEAPGVFDAEVSAAILGATIRSTLPGGTLDSVRKVATLLRDADPNGVDVQCCRSCRSDAP
jgi:hypothetical protein